MIKDIGIDLGEFGMDESVTDQQDLTDATIHGQSNQQPPLSHMPGIQLPTQPATLSLSDTGGAMLPAGTHIQSIPTAPVASASSASQLVAHIQQPLPLAAAGAATAAATTTATAATGQLQLIQGPDGQFVLQSAPTTILAQQVCTSKYIFNVYRYKIFNPLCA